MDPKRDRSLRHFFMLFAACQYFDLLASESMSGENLDLRKPLRNPSRVCRFYGIRPRCLQSWWANEERIQEAVSSTRLPGLCEGSTRTSVSSAQSMKSFHRSKMKKANDTHDRASLRISPYIFNFSWFGKFVFINSRPYMLGYLNPFAQ